MKKTVLVTICLLIVALSVSGCIAGTHSDEKSDFESDQTTSSNSQGTDNTNSYSEGNQVEDSEPIDEVQTKTCPHCGGDPFHVCQQCPDECYLCGGSGYVYE